MSGWGWVVDRDRYGALSARRVPAEAIEVARLAEGALAGRFIAATPPSARAVAALKSSSPIVKRLNRASVKGTERAAALEAPMADRVLRPALDRAADAAVRRFVELTASSAAPDGPGWIIPAADELLDVDALAARLDGKVRPVAVEIAKAVWEAAVGDGAALSAAAEPEVTVKFTVTHPYLGALLDGIASRLRNAAETFKEDLRGEVLRAYDQGLGVADAAIQIRERLKGGNPGRAELIVRTEFTALTNGSSLAAAQMVDTAGQEAGHAPLRKIWLCGSGAPNPRHELVAGLDQQTRPLKEAFDVNGSAMMHPGDSNGPANEAANCRCSIGYLV